MIWAAFAMRRRKPNTDETSNTLRKGYFVKRIASRWAKQIERAFKGNRAALMIADHLGSFGLS